MGTTTFEYLVFIISQKSPPLSIVEGFLLLEDANITL